jgi:DNA-binding LytR/AlgR family response regulator
MYSSMHSALAGTSVFVLEDESLLLFELEEMLAELGCTVVGPAMRLDQADAMLETAAAADIAVLDVNIGGRLVFPLAQKLRERNLPIVFATGYDREGLPPDWRNERILPKPYSREQVAAALLELAQRH